MVVVVAAVASQWMFRWLCLRRGGCRNGVVKVVVVAVVVAVDLQVVAL